MKRTAVKSSQIHSIGFDPDSKTLEIEFARKDPKVEGSIYQYANITPSFHKELMEAESQGSFFINRIKRFPTAYPYKRIDPTKTEKE